MTVTRNLTLPILCPAFFDLEAGDQLPMGFHKEMLLGFEGASTKNRSNDQKKTSFLEASNPVSQCTFDREN